MTERTLIYSPTGDRNNQDLINEKAARLYNINFGMQIKPSHKAFYIDLSGKRMTLKALKLMAKYFESSIAPAVKMVNLSNRLVQGGHNNTMLAFALITKALGSSTLLQVLNLSNNNLGSDGIKNLEDMLTKTTLERLDISNARLKVQDAKDLFKFLCPRKITHLCMSNNPSVATDNGQVVASFVQKCKNVVYLELSSISPGRDGTLAITKALHNLAEEKAPLVSVNLNRFHFGNPKNLEELKGALGNKSLQSLEHVNLMNSRIPSTEQEALQDLLYFNNVGLKPADILLGDDTDGDSEEQESQFVELSMHG